MAQSALANNGRKVGLLRGAGTQMALWFYAMMRLLRLKQPLIATIHQQKFVDLNLNDTVRGAVQDIKDDKFWKCIYFLLRVVFPALRLLRYCDKSKSAMDKIFFLSHRTAIALYKSEEFLNDRHLFGYLRTDSNLNREGNMVLGDRCDEESDGESVVFGDDDNIQPEDESESEMEDDAPTELSEEFPYNSVMSFGCQVIWHWNKRKKHIEHEYAIAGWALCIMDDVRKDVLERLQGIHRDAIAEFVRRLHVPPCPNTNQAVSSMSMPEIIDTFWNEFRAFQDCTPPYHEPSRWASYDVAQGNSYLWHEKYSIPYTSVLGFVACRVTSKLCGIGPAERSWGGVKQIKDGKRSHLSGASTEKRTILFVSSKISQTRTLCDRMEQLDAKGHNAMFGDDDINFDLQLENFGVDMWALKEPAIERVFQAWVEDWEEDARKKNDCVNEALLLAKYKGLVFRDPDSGRSFSVWEQNMEFCRGRGNGWFVVAVSADDEDDNKAFSLELACELIGVTPQKDGVQVITHQTDD
jgi:hypothetical protein